MEEKTSAKNIILDCIDSVREAKDVEREVKQAKLASYYEGVRDGIASVQAAVWNLDFKEPEEMEEACRQPYSGGAFEDAAGQIFAELGGQLSVRTDDLDKGHAMGIGEKCRILAERINSRLEDMYESAYNTAITQVFTELGRKLGIQPHAILEDPDASIDEKYAVIEGRAQALRRECYDAGCGEAARKIFYELGRELDVATKDLADGDSCVEEKCAACAARVRAEEGKRKAAMRAAK